ncbi:MAG: AraC family ligand binding domain-containing protein, partial [Terrimicrobiaceae bacterium]
MAAPLKNITQTLIIPPGSRERFIGFRTPPDAAGWFGNGVGLSGLSDLRKGYLVHRPGCSHHFIGIVIRGKIWYRNGEDNVEISPGDLVFLRAGTLHHYESSQGLSMFWFHLDPTHCRWEYLAARDAFHRPARCLEEARGLMERAFSESQSPLHHPDGVRESLCCLILAYLDRELEQDAAESSVIMRTRLEKVWREVGRGLAKDWNILSLARLTGMSL